MRQKKYLYDLFVQIVLIFAVMAIFKLNPSRVQASFWASVLFVLMPISMMMREWLFYRGQNKLWWAAVIQFWLLFAVPIFVLRIQNPHSSISEITVGPISMQLWHQLSNYSYIILFAVTGWSAWITHRNKTRPN